MTDEQRKRLTEEVLHECYHETPQVSLRCTKCNMFVDYRDQRTFDNEADMMALFRKIVDSLHFGAFQNFAYKHFNEYPNYTMTEWLFYDPERFCNLVAEWLEEVK